MVKVFIIDSHPVFRFGLGSVLGGNAEFQVVGDASSVKEALPKVSQVQPDILILDLHASGDDIDAISLLKEKCPKGKVIVLTSSEKRDEFFRAIKAGAKGYLMKNLDFGEFIDSIRLVASGSAIVYSAVAARLLTAPEGTSRDGKNGLSSLSAREKEVLQFVARGATNKEIAVQCYVSPTTVKAHLRRILEKLEVKNRAQAVACAMEKGFFTETGKN